MRSPMLLKIRLAEWREGLPTGKAVITSGGNLKARHVIHTVGPIWHGGEQREFELLAEAYSNSLKLAVSKGLKTLAFPSISTGAFGFPVEKASLIALITIKEFAEKENSLEEINLVLFTPHDFKVYAEEARKILNIKFN